MPSIDRFEQFGDILLHAIDVTNKEVVLALWNGLVDGTPVKSGLAHASWFISAGRPVTKKLSPGSYSRPSQPDLGRYTRNYTKWFVVNTADHIQRLNDGYSRKAPAGFIESTVNNVGIKFGG